MDIITVYISLRHRHRHRCGNAATTAIAAAATACTAVTVVDVLRQLRSLLVLLSLLQELWMHNQCQHVVHRQVQQTDLQAFFFPFVGLAHRGGIVLAASDAPPQMHEWTWSGGGDGE
jgi:hypothetical protein